MNDHQDRETGDQSENAQRADSAFHFGDGSASKEGQPQRLDVSAVQTVVQEHLEESAEEHDFYRGSGATADAETTRFLHLPDHRTVADTFNRVLPLLLGVGILSAIIVTVVVGMSTWITLQGTNAALIRTVIGGGGLFTGTIFMLYIGWTLGYNPA